MARALLVPVLLAVLVVPSAGLVAPRQERLRTEKAIFPRVYAEERNELRPLPPTYIVDRGGRSPATRELLEQQLEQLAVAVSRVPAEENPALAHRSAIAQAHKDGAEVALVVEAPGLAAARPSWATSLRGLAARAPSDWELLRLLRDEDSSASAPCDAAHLYISRGKESSNSTVVYLINRAGMREVLESPPGLPFDATRTYDLACPLAAFRTESARAGDTAKSLSDRSIRQTIAVLATTTATDDSLKRVLDNARYIANTRDDTSWVYAVNAVDNEENAWYSKVRPVLNRLGIYFAVRARGGDQPGYESKLVSQLPLIRAIDTSVGADFFWLLDGDVSFLPTDMARLTNALVTKPMPVIAQLQIEGNPDGRSRFEWGTQWFKPLNVGQPTCGISKVPVPFIESQAPILSAEFLRWYMPSLEEAARIQRQAGCDWGHDELWCTAASRYVSEIGADGLDACALFSLAAVRHDNTRQIALQAGKDDWRDDKRFVLGCKSVLSDLESSQELSRDFTDATALNRWWDQPGMCEALQQNRSKPASYRAFAAWDKLQQLAKNL